MNEETRKAMKEAQRKCWERHNPARNVAHKHPNIMMRVMADAAWWKEHQEISVTFAAVEETNGS